MHCFSDENVFAGKRTELCLQVYLPSSKYDLQLDIACCNFSDWRQKEQLDDREIAHLQRFLRVERIIKILDRKIKNLPWHVLLNN